MTKVTWVALPALFLCLDRVETAIINSQTHNPCLCRIQDEMHLAKEKALSDANAYRMKALAESNTALLSPQYLEMIKYQAVANSTKIYFGPSIPGLSPETGLESKVFTQYRLIRRNSTFGLNIQDL